jgi:hypothetical protein
VLKAKKGDLQVRVKCSMFAANIILFVAASNMGLKVDEIAAQIHVDANLTSSYLQAMFKIKGFEFLKSSDIKMSAETVIQVNSMFDFQQKKEIENFPNCPQTVLYCFSQDGKDQSIRKLRCKFYQKRFEQKFQSIIKQHYTILLQT